jgi:hypothetical protein
VGGITSAEIASLRFLSKMQGKGSGFDFMIATTKVITGDDLVEACIEKFE